MPDESLRGLAGAAIEMTDAGYQQMGIVHHLQNLYKADMQRDEAASLYKQSLDELAELKVQPGAAYKFHWGSQFMVAVFHEESCPTFYRLVQ